jgi:hypothetical protein
MPEMREVDSSAIEAVGYDPDTRELHVRFKDTGLYVYSGVDIVRGGRKQPDDALGCD